MTIGDNDTRSGKNVYCAWCGTHLVPGAHFCSSCGRMLHVEESPVPDTPPAEWIEDELGATPEAVEDSATQVIPATSDESPSSEEPLWQSFTSVDQAPVDSDATKKVSRRGLLVVAGALALLILASAGAFAGYRHLQEQPAREAFEDAQAVFGPLVASLGQGEDLEQLAIAGERAAEAVDVMRRHESKAAGGDTEESARLGSVVTAELAVTEAAAGLQTIEEDDLVGWNDTHPQLLAAVQALTAASKALSGSDPERAGAIPDVAAPLANVEQVVGAAVASSAESQLTELLGDLVAAKRTAQVRAVAETAGIQAGTLQAATDSTAEGSVERKDLEGYATVYAAVQGLGVLDPESLDKWASLRQSLTVALTALDPDSSVATDGRQAVASIHRLVVRGRDALTDWRAKYDSAVTAKANDTEALGTYKSAMEAQLRSYSTLRGDLSEWIERVEDPTTGVTYDEAYNVLSQAQWDRQMVRDEMNDLAVPEQMTSTHNALVAVVDDAITAVQAAYDGASDAQFCVTACYYKDTPGWQRFSAESGRITDAFRAAEENWKSALASAEAVIAGRELPRKPQV